MAAMHEVTLPVRLTTTAVVGPGEKLIIGISEPISLEQHRWMTGKLQEALPGVECVVIDRCSSLAVYRDEQPTDAAIMRWIQANPNEFEMWITTNDAIRLHQGRA